ncbi:MAG: tyrosine-type recombinase/integrase [Caldilineaceae bacterium]|nr:tyrosine-type recombinase/integrase [Caldilineaceae bacterium]
MNTGATVQTEVYHNLQIDVKNFVFSLPPEQMYIDLRPTDAIEPATIDNSQQPALNYLIGLGESSRQSMYGALVIIAGVLSAGRCSPLDLPWWKLTYSHTNAVRAWCVQNRAPATGRRYMAALRGVLKEAWRLGLMDIEGYNRAIDLKPIKGSGKEQAAGRALSDGEKRAILATLSASDEPKAIRNAALFGLAVYGGLRRAELARLHVDDYDPDTGQLTIHGKGNKQRTVYVAPGVDDALADWLAVRGGASAPGALFTHILKSGEVTDSGITAAAIYKIIMSIQEEAEVKPFSPHDLRRTFAGDLLDAGADISTVQKLMGHASATTTASYDRRGERSKKEAMGRLHMPYTRRVVE